MRNRSRRSRSRSRNRKKSSSNSRSPGLRRVSRSPDISHYGKLNRTTIAYATSLAAELSKRRKMIEMKQAKEKEKEAVAAKDDGVSETVVAKQDRKTPDRAAEIPDQETTEKSGAKVISDHKVDFSEEVKLIALPPNPPPLQKVVSKPSSVSTAPSDVLATTSSHLQSSDGSPMSKQSKKNVVLSIGDILILESKVTPASRCSLAAEKTITTEKSTSDVVFSRSLVAAERVTPRLTRLTDLPMPPLVEDDCDSVNEEPTATRYHLIQWYTKVWTCLRKMLLQHCNVNV